MMDKNWSEKNEKMQMLLNKKDTFNDAISLLIELRKDVFNQITQIIDGYPKEAFYQMPFEKTDGYHGKTLSYSIWHIFRIEDIVAHEMIENDKQILFRSNYIERINAPIITTGNELSKEEIITFSKTVNHKELYNYAKDVFETTNQILLKLEYADLKRKFDDVFKKKLIESKSVSDDEKANWLIEYWCNKDVKGLIKMPFSRHHIMHVEAMCRIKNELCKKERKGIDPIAYCGFSCNHCFLSKWCGSCRTSYNVCSYAKCSPNGECLNVACCKGKNIDGCYECDELVNCQKGFYTLENDGASAAKAQALYIRKYGKKAFLKVHDRLCEKYEFKKTQEILGQDIWEGLKFLEED